LSSQKLLHGYGFNPAPLVAKVFTPPGSRFDWDHGRPKVSCAFACEFPLGKLAVSISDRSCQVKTSRREGTNPLPCASRQPPPLHAQAPRGGLLRTVTPQIFPMFPPFSRVAQAPRGVLSAVSCRKRGAYAKKGEVIDPSVSRRSPPLPLCPRPRHLPPIDPLRPPPRGARWRHGQRGLPRLPRRPHPRPQVGPRGAPFGAHRQLYLRRDVIVQNFLIFFSFRVEIRDCSTSAQRTIVFNKNITGVWLAICMGLIFLTFLFYHFDPNAGERPCWSTCPNVRPHRAFIMGLQSAATNAAWRMGQLGWLMIA